MKTLLIADDEPSLRLLVSATVESDDYDVIEAADGEEAWALILKHKPIVALLDVQMPGRTGLELTQAIKHDPRLSHIQVILLTAKAQESDVDAGLNAGADQYLTKPFSPMELSRALDRLLAKT